MEGCGRGYMIILTLKERQFIDEAVLRFGDDRERVVWRDWKLAHPAIRYEPAGSDDDGSGRMPSGIAEMMTTALARFERFLHTRIASVEVSDDEAGALCNDLAEINSIVDAIRAAT
jgi:hypothetical protein